MADYVSTVLKKEISVQSLVTVHYFEYASDFSYPGESHDFWEFLYVDKGQIEVTAGRTDYILKQGAVIFHKPHEFHRLWADGIIAPNLVVVSFCCDSPAMSFFENKILTLNDSQCALLGTMLEEARRAFSSNLANPYLKKLERRAGQPFGAEQVLSNTLELLLLSLIRAGGEPPSRATSVIRRQAWQDTFSAVTGFLHRNIGARLTLEDICRQHLCSVSSLQKVFREKTGGGVMEYFGKMKISRAKQEIREGKKNFTQVASDLGYSSVHYFSRHFKKVTGMTPTEYASSVKLLADSPEGDGDPPAQ